MVAHLVAGYEAVARHVQWRIERRRQRIVQHIRSLSEHREALKGAIDNILLAASSGTQKPTSKVRMFSQVLTCQKGVIRGQLVNACALSHLHHALRQRDCAGTPQQGNLCRLLALIDLDCSSRELRDAFR